MKTTILEKLSLATLATVASVMGLTPSAQAGSMWTYSKDNFADGSGGSSMEIHGIAYREEGNKVTFALNANVALTGVSHNKAKDKNVGWGDLFINLNPNQTLNQAFQSGNVLGVRFAGTNDSGIDGNVLTYSTTPGQTGVYTEVTGKTVADSNNGYASLSAYEKKYPKATYGDTDGDTALDKTYFGDTSAKNVIDTHKKRIGDVQFISDVTSLGLDWQKNMGGQGSQTIAFSLDRSLFGENSVNWIASVFLECLNDGVGMHGNFAAIPKLPPDVQEVPEPATLMGLGLVFGGMVASRRRKAN